MAQPRDNFSEFDDTIGPIIATPATEQNSGGARFSEDDRKELIRERNAAQTARDDAIKSMLDGHANAATQATATQPAAEPKIDENYALEGLPDDTDPEVVTLLSSVLSAERRRTEEDMGRRYGPAMERIERETSLNEIENVVPGFKEDLINEVEQMFRELPADQQALYDNRVGIEALASRVRLQRLESGIQSGGAEMASNAPVRRSPPPSSTGGVSAEDIWNLSEDEFDTALERIRISGGG